jgi:hypothetical protein
MKDPGVQIEVSAKRMGDNRAKIKYQHTGQIINEQARIDPVKAFNIPPTGFFHYIV